MGARNTRVTCRSRTAYCPDQRIVTVAARNLIICLVFLALLASTALAQTGQKRKFPLAKEHGKIIESGGKVLLYGGKDESWHFDITQFRLDVNKLHHGIGREQFDALIGPEFVTASEADSWLGDDKRVLAVAVGGEVKAYPLTLMTRHEAVNDVVGGVPVMPVFCILADLGSVYDRRMMGHTFTFGVSGYTYADPAYWDGMNAFVLWDRDTESLWWPLTGTAVSGPLIDKPLKLLDETLWSQTTWGELKALHPDAIVMAPGQTIDPQSGWPRLSDDEVARLNGQSSTADSLAPRWGVNPSLENSRPQGSGKK